MNSQLPTSKEPPGAGRVQPQTHHAHIGRAAVDEDRTPRTVTSGLSMLTAVQGLADLGAAVVGEADRGHSASRLRLDRHLGPGEEDARIRLVG